MRKWTTTISTINSAFGIILFDKDVCLLQSCSRQTRGVRMKTVFSTDGPSGTRV